MSGDGASGSSSPARSAASAPGRSARWSARACRSSRSTSGSDRPPAAPDHDRRRARPGHVRRRRHHRPRVARTRRSTSTTSRTSSTSPRSRCRSAAPIRRSGRWSTSSARSTSSRPSRRRAGRDGPGRLHELDRDVTPPTTPIRRPAGSRVDADAHPRNHYGVYKLANEGNARVYWLDDGPVERRRSGR